MSYTEWKDKTAEFKTVDVRGVAGNFFPGLKKQAMQIPVGSGMEIIQSFEPIPLYDVMDQLCFDRETVKASDNEYHAYFYRTEMKQDLGDIPMRPAALTNFPMIDNDLAEIAVNFWDLTFYQCACHLF